MRCLWAIQPLTLLWGASFPLALAATQKLILVLSVASAWLLLAPRFREVSVAFALAVS